MHQKPDTGTDHKKSGEERRLDLSLPQVAGSALAAVAAAVLASRLGVYGTIIGAGVVSVVATCGGSVFQHLFSRTGEQIREAAVPTRPRAGRTRGPSPAPGAAYGTRPGAPCEAAHGTEPDGTAHDEEFGAATTHGTRVRGWKRPLIAASVVFGVAMAGVTGLELASGSELGGDGRGGTTVGSVVRGGNGGGASDDGPAHSPDREEEREQDPAPGGEESTEPDPGREPGDGTDEAPGGSAVPTPTPSRPGGTPTEPGLPGDGSEERPTDGSSSPGAGTATPTPPPTPQPGSTGAATPGRP